MSASTGTRAPPPFHWRPARAVDVPALAALYGEAARRLGPLVYDAEQVAAWMSFALNRPGFARYVLDHDTWLALREGLDAPIGFCGIDPAGELREVHALYVHPDACRRGVGAEMLRRTLGRAREGGARRFAAWVTPFSRPVFQRCGFAWTETVRGEFAGAMFTRYRVEQEP